MGGRGRVGVAAAAATVGAKAVAGMLWPAEVLLRRGGVAAGGVSGVPAQRRSSSG